MQGVAVEPRPIILFGASNGLEFDGSASNGTISELEVDQAGSGASVTALAIGFGCAVDNVIALGGAFIGWTCLVRRDRDKHGMHKHRRGGVAILTQANLAATIMTFRNVTTVATGASSTVIELHGVSGRSLNAAVVNTIAQGASNGLLVFTDSTANASSVAHVSYSDIPPGPTSASRGRCSRGRLRMWRPGRW